MRGGTQQSKKRQQPVAATADDGAGVTVDFGDATVVAPALWLRQACGCVTCRTSPLGQRTYELDELLDGLQIDGAVAAPRSHVRTVTADGVEIEFVAPGGFETAGVATDGDATHLGYVPFEAIRSGFVSAAYDRATWPSDDEWLLDEAVDVNDAQMASLVSAQIASRGLALVRDVATRPGEVLTFASCLGFVRDTNYGAIFDVRAAVDPENLAYSSLGLSPHTDNPYRDPCPTVQLLHCLRQAGTGGRSIFVDGFAIAGGIQTSRPADFAILSTTRVAFQYHDDDVDLRSVAPIIATSTAGDVQQLRINNRSMVGPVGLSNTKDVQAFFEAYRRLVADLHEPASACRLRLEPGDVVVFDNRRVLHGRDDFELGEGDGDRWLQGCYIDIDAVLSIAQRHSGTKRA